MGECRIKLIYEIDDRRYNIESQNLWFIIYHHKGEYKRQLERLPKTRINIKDKDHLQIII